MADVFDIGIENEISNINDKKKQYPCDTCDKTYESKRYLAVHKRTHTGEKPYICDQCGKTFVDKGYHSFHMKEKHTEVNESHPCSLCGKVLKTKRGLLTHMDLHQVQIYGSESKYRRRPKDLYTCPSCDKGFGDMTHLNRHLLTHENNGKQNRKNGMKSRNDNSFRKEIAEYALKTSIKEAIAMYNVSDTMVRRSIKLLQESEMCPVCGKEFGWQTELVRHMKDVHKDESLSGTQLHQVFINTIKNGALEKDMDEENGDSTEGNIILGENEKPRITSIIEDKESTEEIEDGISMNIDSNQMTKEAVFGDRHVKVQENVDVELIQEEEYFDKLKGHLNEQKSNDSLCNEETKKKLFYIETHEALVDDNNIKQELTDELKEVNLEGIFCNQVLDYLHQDMKEEEIFNTAEGLFNEQKSNEELSDEKMNMKRVDKKNSEKELLVKEEFGEKNMKEILNADIDEKNTQELMDEIDETVENKECLQKDKPQEEEWDNIVMSASGLYKCPNCPKSFQHKKNVKKHIKVVHMQTRDIQCDKCLKLFPFRSDLKRHMKSHTLEKKLKCDFCDQYFGHNWTLKKHILSFHSKRTIECQLCDKMFPDQTMLQLHLKRHGATRMFACDVCTKQFKQKCSLKEHMRLHNEDEQYICDKCPKKFLTIRRLKDHDISAHMDKESSENFNCISCEKIFFSQKSLRDHTFLHRDVKETMCNFCGSTFTGQRKLKYHIRNVHSDKSFACDLCSKRFSSNAKLIRHTKYHLKQKDFACQNCPKTFYDKRSLDEHVNIVHEDNPERFPCVFCLKTYTRKNNIKSHLLVCKKNPMTIKDAEAEQQTESDL